MVVVDVVGLGVRMGSVVFEKVGGEDEKDEGTREKSGDEKGADEAGVSARMRCTVVMGIHALTSVGGARQYLPPLLSKVRYVSSLRCARLIYVRRHSAGCEAWSR